MPSFSLYLVATPIGNLEDITLRAIRILKECSLIVAEDTRHSRILLDHYDIKTQVESFHDHNSYRKIPQLIDHLQHKGDVAMISDAGTPCIADPGFPLVREALQAEIQVIPVPGPCSLIAGLISCGLPSDHFTFENFAPKKSGQRKTMLNRIKDSSYTHAFFASPHQIVSFMEEIQEVLPGVKVVCMRELTKKFEERISGTAAELSAHFKVRPPKGEFLVFINPSVNLS